MSTSTLNNTVTSEQDAISLEVRIEAPRERVFEALTDPQQTIQWWGQRGIYHGTKWCTDVRQGGKWRCEGVGDTDGKPFHVAGEYLQVDPPRLLEYTWEASWTETMKTVVRVELEATAGGTIVRLRHSGFTGVPAAAREHYQGWQHVVGWLKAFVENGDTVATRPAFVMPTPPEGTKGSA